MGLTLLEVMIVKRGVVDNMFRDLKDEFVKARKRGSFLGRKLTDVRNEERLLTRR